MPLSTTATVTCWPLVRSHTLLKPRARCAHGSPVRCARPRWVRQSADGCGMPGTGAGGPGAFRCAGCRCAVGVPCGRDGAGDPVADGCAAAPADPAMSVSGISAETTNPEASAATANRLMPWPPGTTRGSPRPTLGTPGHGCQRKPGAAPAALPDLPGAVDSAQQGRPHGTLLGG